MYTIVYLFIDILYKFTINFDSYNLTICNFNVNDYIYFNSWMIDEDYLLFMCKIMDVGYIVGQWPSCCFSNEQLS